MRRLIWLVMLLLLFALPAEAQITRQTALANICINEAGFQTHSTDCVLIAEVLRNRSSTGRVTIGIMQNYSTNVFNRSRIDQRRWIPFMRPVPHEPNGWYSHLSWEDVYYRRYMMVYRHAGRILRGDIEAPYSPDHWGAPSIRRMRQREGWQLVSKGRRGLDILPGESYNDFWMVPGNFVECEEDCSFPGFRD